MSWRGSLGASLAWRQHLRRLFSKLVEAGHGARGIVFGSYGPGQPGHVFNVVNQSGAVRYLDGQTGKSANLLNFDTLQLLRTN